MVKNDGKLLEKVVKELCSGIKNVEVLHNVKIESKSGGKKRQVDVLIKGKIGAFDVNIEVECKDYNKKVGVTTVDSFIGKLGDSYIDLGVMVSSKGFTENAIKRAKLDGIQLYTATSEFLGNSNLFIPIRLIIPEIESFSCNFVRSCKGEGFYLPFNLQEDLRILKDNKELNLNEFLIKAWNNGKIPNEKGEHCVNFDAVKIKDINNPNYIQYCELKYYIKIKERYFLRLEKANYLKNYNTSKKNYKLPIF